MWKYNEDADEELNKIFSKHLNKDNILKEKVNFGKSEVLMNQRELDEFQKYDIIKKQAHFCLDDKEVINSDDEEEVTDNNQPNNLNRGYFKSIIDETKQNENLYCSYLDHFDKIWINNKKFKNKASISCASCFNQISYESQAVKYFTNVNICSKMIQGNTFIDYLETYNNEKLIAMLNEWLKTNESININSTDEKLKELGIDSLDNENPSRYVSVKCSTCYILLGAYDSANKHFLIVNSI